MLPLLPFLDIPHLGTRRTMGAVKPPSPVGLSNPFLVAYILLSCWGCGWQEVQEACQDKGATLAKGCQKPEQPVSQPPDRLVCSRKVGWLRSVRESGWEKKKKSPRGMQVFLNNHSGDRGLFLEGIWGFYSKSSCHFICFSRGERKVSSNFCRDLTLWGWVQSVLRKLVDRCGSARGELYSE